MSNGTNNVSKSVLALAVSLRNCMKFFYVLKVIIHYGLYFLKVRVKIHDSFDTQIPVLHLLDLEVWCRYIVHVIFYLT